MSRIDKEYMIPFMGLKLGAHEFEFEILEPFFESIEFSNISSGKVKVNFTLDKKETMMIGDFHLEGFVTLPCDRCNDLMDVDIEGDYRLVYKFDDQPSDDEALRIVYQDEAEINIKADISEFITVSIPARVVHDEGECNEEMIEIFSNYVINSDEEYEEEDDDDDDEEDVDPRWDALRKI